MKKSRIIFYAVLLFLSIAILAGTYVSVFFLRKSEHVIDSEYAVAEFHGDIETKDFSFAEFTCLYFLSGHDPLTEFSKKTCPIGATPSLKIVNSNEYKVEITANSDVFEKIKIGVSERTDTRDYSSLVITFADECYVPVHMDDESYDYDTGLYVTLDKFDVTVYAPISYLRVDSKVKLDYEAPECQDMFVGFSYEGTEGEIRNINTNDFKLYCGGTSNIKLSGEVRGETKINVYHNTKIDANGLVSETVDFSPSSSYFGVGEFSYIKYNGKLYPGIITLLTGILLHIFPVCWLALMLSCIVKYRRINKQTDKVEPTVSNTQ